MDFSLIISLLTLVVLIIWVADIAYFARRRATNAADGTKLPLPWLSEQARLWLPVLLVVLVVRSFVIEPFRIPSGSMIPTLKVGDFILVNKYAYGLKLPFINLPITQGDKPKRGEIVVFVPPDKNAYFIKRVIGLPGDKIEYINKIIYVNGKEMKQTLLAELPPLNPIYRVVEEHLDEKQHQSQMYINIPANNYETTVAPEHYFLMGDNRDNSLDSRSWGQIKNNDIVGRALAVWMNWQGGLRWPDFRNIRKIR